MSAFGFLLILVVGVLAISSALEKRRFVAEGILESFETLSAIDLGVLLLEGGVVEVVRTEG